MRLGHKQSSERWRNMKRPRLPALILALAVGILLLLRPIALAEEAKEPAPEASTNATGEGAVTVSRGGDVFELGNDAVWFGERLSLSKATVKNDLLAAGRNISVDSAKVGGSIRVAGQDILVSDTTLKQNATVAGETIQFLNTQAECVAAAGRFVSFEGSCKRFIAYANDVVINGKVEGDVEIGASHVEVGPSARITGTMHVTSGSDPVIDKKAQIGDVQVTYEKTEEPQVEESQPTEEETKEEKAEEPQVKEEEPKEEAPAEEAPQQEAPAEEAPQQEAPAQEAPQQETPQEEAPNPLAGVFAVFGAVFTVLGIVSTIVIALLSEWLFKRHTADAAEMVRTRTGITIGTGVVGMLVSPFALILLCILVLTLPVAGILALTLGAIAVAANGFAGASVFRLAFPKLNRFVCALVGGAIMGVMGAIPFIGTIAGIAAYVYLLGYILQVNYLRLRAEKQD